MRRRFSARVAMTMHFSRCKRSGAGANSDSTSVRANGDNIGAGRALAIWRHRHRHPASASVHIKMRFSASAVFGNHRTMETRLAGGNAPTTRLQGPNNGAATPPKLQEKFPDGVPVKNSVKFTSMQRVYGNLAERILDIVTSQHDAGTQDMALAKVQNPYIHENGNKLAWWGS